MMSPEALYRLAPPLIALQFLSLAWTVNRQIRLPDAERQTVISLPDMINLTSMFATIASLVVLPILTGSYSRLSWMVLGGAWVLLAFHPIAIAAHHGLWTRRANTLAARAGTRFRYVNREEVFTSLLSVLAAALFAVCLGKH